MQNKPKYIIIHCTDVSEKTIWDQLVSVNKYHKGLNFTRSSLGYYVGYHRLITGGVNYKCKEDDEEGCHTNQSEGGVSINFLSLGVCVGFDGDIEQMNPTHYTLLRAQVLAWQKQYNIPNFNVKFHRYFNLFKTCPGSLLKQPWLDTLLDTDVTPISKTPTQQIKQDGIINIQEQLNFIQRSIINIQTLINNLFKKS